MESISKVIILSNIKGVITGIRHVLPVLDVLQSVLILLLRFIVTEKALMSGNHVAGEAAVRAGCRFYAGYPITPQNELTEYMASAMSKVNEGIFIQAEIDLAAINMVIGASVTGCRAMTSSSSPGISLKQEGISFLSALELPAVIVNCL